MELAAPGIKKEYCRVAINDEGNLSIAIENKQEHKHEDKHHHYLRREPKQKVTKAIEVS